MRKLLCTAILCFLPSPLLAATLCGFTSDNNGGYCQSVTGATGFEIYSDIQIPTVKWNNAVIMYGSPAFGQWLGAGDPDNNTLIQGGWIAQANSDGTTDYVGFYEAVGAGGTALTSSTSWSGGPYVILPNEVGHFDLKCITNCTPSAVGQQWTFTALDCGIPLSRNCSYPNYTSPKWSFSININFVDSMASAQWVTENPQASGGHLLDLPNFGLSSLLNARLCTTSGCTPANPSLVSGNLGSPLNDGSNHAANSSNPNSTGDGYLTLYSDTNSSPTVPNTPAFGLVKGSGPGGD